MAAAESTDNKVGRAEQAAYIGAPLAMVDNAAHDEEQQSHYLYEPDGGLYEFVFYLVLVHSHC